MAVTTQGKGMPEIQHVLPKYLQIAGHIRDQIVLGDLPPGAEVPSERELAAEWKVARPTATRALATLRTQGFVTSVQGSGTYVRDPSTVPRARERYERAALGSGMYGAAESVEFVAVELTDEVPPHVVEILRLDADATVIRRARLLRNGERRPIELSTSWFPGHLATRTPALLEPSRLVGGTAKYIAETVGQEPAYGRDQVSARLASAEETGLLELSERAAVLAYRFTVYDKDDQPIQTDDDIYPPGQWAFQQEYPLAR
ncbi:MAG: GntR family transcriptional regulator [Nocardioides sp.]